MNKENALREARVVGTDHGRRDAMQVVEIASHDEIVKMHNDMAQGKKVFESTILGAYEYGQLVQDRRRDYPPNDISLEHGIMKDGSYEDYQDVCGAYEKAYTQAVWVIVRAAYVKP